jgi:hypothetical protein
MFKLRILHIVQRECQHAEGISNMHDAKWTFKLCVRVRFRLLADVKMSIFVRTSVCVWGASSGATYLRVRVNLDVLKQKNK